MEVNSARIRASIINAGERERRTLALPPGFPNIEWSPAGTLSWLDQRARGRGYLLRSRNGRLEGLLVRATQATDLPHRAIMCSLCRFTARFNEVCLYVATRTGRAGARGDSVGRYICTELSCVDRMQDPPLPDPLHPSPDEVIAARFEGYASRLDEFFADVLRGSDVPRLK